MKDDEEPLFPVVLPDLEFRNKLFPPEGPGKSEGPPRSKKQLKPKDLNRLNEIMGQLHRMLNSPRTRFHSKNELYQRLQLSKAEIKNVEGKYVEENIFVEQKIKTTVRRAVGGRSTVFLRFPKDTEFEHEYWVYRALHVLEKKGLRVEPGRFDCDLVSIDDRGRIEGFEIENAGSKSLKNLVRNLESGFSAVTVVCLTEEVRQKAERLVQAHISAEDRKKITVTTKFEFFRPKRAS